MKKAVVWGRLILKRGKAGYLLAVHGSEKKEKKGSPFVYFKNKLIGSRSCACSSLSNICFS